MKVEIQWRWLAVFVSVVVLVLLRNHRTLLVAYTLGVVLVMVAALLLLPRLAARAERAFTQAALGALARGDAAGLTELASRQRLLRLTGRGWIIDETLGRGALAQRDGVSARQHVGRALASAPADRRAGLELALAEAEVLSGDYDPAEGRLRALMSAPHPGPDPRPLLARVLLERDAADAHEAAALLRAALPTAGPRQRSAVRGQLALALALTGDSGWASALAEARSGGADSALCDRVEAAAVARGLAA